MKKVLCVFDGAHFSEGSLQFAARLNDIAPILLTGVFLSPLEYSDTLIYYLGGMGGPIYMPDVTYDIGSMASSIKRFEDFCLKSGIEYRVHRNETGIVPDILDKESRFADVMIIGCELYYKDLSDINQREYLQDTMHQAECPVILVPEVFEFPQSIIIAYDGSAASIFALKQYAYLFPELAALPTLIVYASEGLNDFPNMAYIEELGGRHFTSLTFFKLQANPKVYFNTWLGDKGNAMLVAGSHGRSYISELFRHSFIRDVVNTHKLPILTAHR